METRAKKFWSCWVLLVSAVGLGACGGGTVSSSARTAKTPDSGSARSSYGASASYGTSATATPEASPASAPPPPADYAPSAPAPTTNEAREEAPSAGERPGLGTEWGETRYSHVSHTAFDRADWDHPTQMASLYYNDREGARAMTHYADYREMGDAIVDVPSMGISISLRDDAGRPLPAFFAQGHTYAIGEAGQRYTIVVSNQSGVRVEAVASVDGLDVLDGTAADFSKRGYLVPAWGNVEIDGFRQSSDHVAAFRFGSVRDSYAARTGSDRNVGVIGVAFFAPRGAPSFPWTGREIERRRTADPFPGHYASPPPPRW
jgi:hypothetical protein